MKISFKTKLLATSIMLAAASTASATPALDASHALSGATVSGLGTAATTVNQTANTAKIYWTTIDTAPNQSLNFVQPSSKSVAINYVTDGQATNFQGSLNANGKVVLINQDGMTFTAGSQVNVGALTASTAGTATETVNANSPYNGAYRFSNFGNGTVNFNGTVNTTVGYVIATAKQINIGSTGTINANSGLVDLEAGSKGYIVDLKGDGKVMYDDATLLDSGKVNVLGTINAKSGSIIVRARANDITSGVINLSGVVDVSPVTSDAAAGSIISRSSGVTSVANLKNVIGNTGKNINVQAGVLEADGIALTNFTGIISNKF